MTEAVSEIGLYGLAVMGQNFALNIASKGFKISVCNRSYGKTEKTVLRANNELKDTPNKDNLTGYKDLKDFVLSIKKPRNIIILVKAGKPVESVIDKLLELLEPNDMIIDGGNEWYINTEKRELKVGKKGIKYMGMGVSGGEEGARYGPSLMPGGPLDGYKRIEHILTKVAAKTNDNTICVTHIGLGGSGNYVKMVHNGIEYGDMQLIAEAYDILKIIGKLTNNELYKVFNDWNNSELNSFLIEITSKIFKKKDDRINNNNNEYLLDKVLDKTGQKGTGMWTVRDAANQGCALPTISSALTARNMSALKNERILASKIFKNNINIPILNNIEKNELINNVKNALYASKIMSYTQGMNLIKKVGIEKEWNLNLGKIASIWKGGCIIRAQFLDRITNAYDNNPNLESLLFDKNFGNDVKNNENGWRKCISIAIKYGVPCPSFSSSLAYYDSYRREYLPANLTQAQRDCFGAHTYQRNDWEKFKNELNDDSNKWGKFVHSEW